MTFIEFDHLVKECVKQYDFNWLGGYCEGRVLFTSFKDVDGGRQYASRKFMERYKERTYELVSSIF